MIEINLLPEGLKLEPKNKKTALGIQPEKILYLMPFVFAILICLHFFLLLAGVVKSNQYRILNNKWQKLEPQKKILETYNKEYSILSEDAKITQQLLAQRINCAQKLNRLSLDLPSGIWFNELFVTPRSLVIKGSAVSLKAEEINLIKSFMDNLKTDAVFFKDFTSLELGTVQRNTIGSYEVSEFTLTANLKSP